MAWCSVAVAKPLTVHALVVADPAGGDLGRQDAQTVETLLLASQRYDTLDHSLLEARIGESAALVYERCRLQEGCWRALAAQAGVEQVVLVERVDEDVLGVRVVDASAKGGVRLGTTGTDAGGEELVDRLFLQPGRLEVSNLPEGAAVHVDGHRVATPHGTDRVQVDPLMAGKHLVEVDAPGHAGLFVAVMVYPDQWTWVSADLAVIEVERRRPVWAPWVGAAVTMGGALALGLTASVGGEAVVP